MRSSRNDVGGAEVTSTSWTWRIFPSSPRGERVRVRGERGNLEMIARTIRARQTTPHPHSLSPRRGEGRSQRAALVQRPIAALIVALFVLVPAATPSAQAQVPENHLAELEKQIEALKRTADELRRASQTNSPEPAVAQSPAEESSPTNRAAVAERRAADPIARIREEGLEHSQAMKTLQHLTEAIGPRLTGSPNMKRANEWTRDQLAAWGLTNAHLEAWGPFGRGWSLKRFSAQIIEPFDIPLVAYPKAWSPGLRHAITANVVYLDATNEAGLNRYRGRLKGAVVLTAPPREVNPRFDPLSIRMSESELLQLANVSDPRLSAPYEGRPIRPPGAAPTGETRAGPGPRRGGGGFGGGLFPGRVMAFLVDEGAALAVSPGTPGDVGTVFVSSATLPASGGRGTNAFGAGARVWSTNAPATVPQIALGTEDYNRLVRMSQEGVALKMAAEMEVEFNADDPMAYNTIAEIPGTDLKREVVMVGGHLDSWHAGTGATDNGTGVAATMEAVRIIQALDLKPRRTIRIALWSGEEQGLMGSRAYVSNHFGYLPAGPRGGGRRSGGSAEGADSAGARSASSSRREVVRRKEYDTLSVYFNLDHGAGKIRGIYLQGNEAVRPFFSKWLQPFADLGAGTITLANSGGTDHTSFEAIGLPGFSFMQDPLDYWSRTHHTSSDVLDRVPADDLKQAATIIAAFVYDAAMLDQKLPRKRID